MMNDRKASYATKDNIMSKLEQKRSERKLKEEDAVFREKRRAEAASSSAIQSYTESDQPENSDDADDCGDDFQDTPKRSHKQVAKTGTKQLYLSQ